MLKVAQVQIAFWDHLYGSTVGDLKVGFGDQVVIKTEWGNEVGRIVALKDISEEELNNQTEQWPLLVRKATTEDLETITSLNTQSPAALEFCKNLVVKYNLPMKVIDARFSLDGGRLIFPFIADGRVDFRQLVKDLTHHFQKSIRLQQIGIRDEAKISGDYGSCGRNLCCKTHLLGLESITSELADLQQIAHRGSERLSGQCGRLRCCLAFEEKTYRELAKDLPAIGSIIKTPQGRGKVIGWHTLKKVVDVQLENADKDIIEFPVK